MTIDYLRTLSYLTFKDCQIDKIQKYIVFTLEENKKYDLTANDDFDSFLIKNVVDSLLIAQFYDFNNHSVIDIGSGAGLPGILLAIYFDKGEFTLVEPMLKRVNFLNKVVELLDLKNVKVVRARAEDYIKESKIKYDYSVSRAVAKTNIMIELSVPFLKVGGSLICYKGIGAKEELKDAKNAIKELKCEYSNIHETRLESSNDYRAFLEFKKLEKSPVKYPRLFKDIKKRPL